MSDKAEQETEEGETKERKKERNQSAVQEIVESTLDLGPSPIDVVGEVGSELQAGLNGATPDPGDIESALSGVEVPDMGTLDPEATVKEGQSLAADQIDTVVDVGSETVEVAIEGGETAGTVLVDTGGEVVEVGVAVGEAAGDVGEDAGELAAEAAAEIVVASLDGL